MHHPINAAQSSRSNALQQYSPPDSFPNYTVHQDVEKQQQRYGGATSVPPSYTSPLADSSRLKT